jgi:uncharacterized membrane protein YfcA
MIDDPRLLAVAGAIFLLAGGIKGVIGMGLPLVAMGLLSLLVPPADAAALLVVPSLVTNCWQLAAGPSFAKTLRRLWTMMIGIALGTWAEGGLLASDTGGRAEFGLGAVLAIYAVLALAKIRIRVPERAERWWSPLIGGATGLVTAATGVFSVPSVPYLEALALERDDLIQALGLSFTVSSLVLGIGLARDGVFDARLAEASLLALVPTLAGMYVGQWVRLRISAPKFRLWFLLGLLALGLHLALHRFL